MNQHRKQRMRTVRVLGFVPNPVSRRGARPRLSRKTDSDASRLKPWKQVLMLFTVAVGIGPAAGWSQLLPQPADAMRFGEFPLALQAAATLPADDRDRALAAISQEQMHAGVFRGSWLTADQIQDDRSRSRAIAQLGSAARRPLDGPSNSNAGPIGRGGGITIGDFFPLINLIQQTIAPDEWTTTQGEGTIMPYVTGVYVDGAGELRRVVVQQDEWLSRLANSAGNSLSPVAQTVELRKVSLIQLERRLQELAARGQPVPSEMQHLAGIYDLRYLIIDRENQDILIAGPAGPWRIDAEGVAVNVTTGRPVLQLDDLVVVLRNVWYEGGRFGCAITPRQENLERTQQFLQDTKLRGVAFRRELQAQVGLQDVEVFGIPGDSTTARVLVEADYRMKLVGMGLEETIHEIPSYFARASKSSGPLPPLDVARWWFTLNFDGIACDARRSVFEIRGSGVKVLSETEFLGPRGQRIHTNEAVGPTKEFAEDFTAHFDKIEQKYPIYNRLRNIFRLALVCSLIHRENLHRELGWHLTYFGLDPANSLHYVPRQLAVPKVVETVINHESQELRQNGKRLRRDMVGVSGGVDCPIAAWVAKVNIDNDLPAERLPDATGRATYLDRRWWWSP